MVQRQNSVCVCVLGGGGVLTLGMDSSFIYSFSYSGTNIYGVVAIFQALCEETKCSKCDQ